MINDIYKIKQNTLGKYVYSKLENRSHSCYIHKKVDLLTKNFMTVQYDICNKLSL
jgi:hypothetical protein